MLLSFTGTVRLQDVPDAHARLSAALAESHSVEIDLSKLEDAPLALAQLVEAARRSAERDGKGLRVSALSAAMRAMLERGGFVGADATSSSFWGGEAS